MAVYNPLIFLPGKEEPFGKRRTFRNSVRNDRSHTGEVAVSESEFIYATVTLKNA
jgi:hypothetical protein